MLKNLMWCCLHVLLKVQQLLVFRGVRVQQYHSQMKKSLPLTTTVSQCISAVCEALRCKQFVQLLVQVVSNITIQNPVYGWEKYCSATGFIESLFLYIFIKLVYICTQKSLSVWSIYCSYQVTAAFLSKSIATANEKWALTGGTRTLHSFDQSAARMRFKFEVTESYQQFSPQTLQPCRT